MTNVLGAILDAKRDEIAALVKVPAGAPSDPRGTRVLACLRRDPPQALRLIAEIKRRSPSAGPLSTTLSVAARAVAYARGGAAMVSVLADGRFFDGSWEHVRLARHAIDSAGLPEPVLVLAKEFVLDERQLEQAAAMGADAVLLIARIVDRSRLRALVRRARSLGLEPLVEVVTEDEVGAAIDADALVIGVNARDLDTLAMDAARAARVLEAIPSDRVAVHLSGLKGPVDVASMARTDADAALVGEALMRLDEPSALLAEMVHAARSTAES